MRQANWHTQDLDALIEDEPDPFDVPIEEVGTPIDLQDQQIRMMARISELSARMGRMEKAGLKCEIRDYPFTTCLACPISHAGIPNSPMRLVCATGRELDRTATETAAMQHRDQWPTP